MDRFRMRAAVLSVAGAAVLVPAVPAAAHGDEDHGAAAGSGNACSVTGAVQSASGVKYEPTTGRYTLKGVMDCTSEKYRHAEITGSGEGILGCFGGACIA
jgi:hypothetical protein